MKWNPIDTVPHNEDVLLHIRLPGGPHGEDGHNCVYVGYVSVFGGITFCTLCTHENADSIDLNNVVAWMPLPELAK